MALLFAFMLFLIVHEISKSIIHPTSALLASYLAHVVLGIRHRNTVLLRFHGQIDRTSRSWTLPPWTQGLLFPLITVNWYQCDSTTTQANLFSRRNCHCSRWDLIFFLRLSNLCCFQDIYGVIVLGVSKIRGPTNPRWFPSSRANGGSKKFGVENDDQGPNPIFLMLPYLMACQPAGAFFSNRP